MIIYVSCVRHVSYKDGNVRRPLFYRLSVAEIFVPYGDARPPFHQKFVSYTTHANLIQMNGQKFQYLSTLKSQYNLLMKESSLWGTR